MKADFNYTLGANVENLTLLGTTAINGTGNTLNNTLTGNMSINTLNGGVGNDTLTGWDGLDSFMFSSALNATTNKDIISDFDVTSDNIQLENIVFAKLTTPGVLASGNFVSGANSVALDIDDFLIYNTTTGTLSYDADGNGAGAKIDFLTLIGMPVLTSADVVII